MKLIWSHYWQSRSNKSCNTKCLLDYCSLKDFGISIPYFAWSGKLTSHGNSLSASGLGSSVSSGKASFNSTCNRRSTVGLSRIWNVAIVRILAVVSLPAAIIANPSCAIRFNVFSCGGKELSLIRWKISGLSSTFSNFLPDCCSLRKSAAW
jgi:hypothetical protein